MYHIDFMFIFPKINCTTFQKETKISARGKGELSTLSMKQSHKIDTEQGERDLGTSERACEFEQQIGVCLDGDRL